MSKEFTVKQRAKPAFWLLYLSNTVDLFFICLSDVEDAGVGQGDGCGALQGGMDGQLAEAIVNPWHLTMHRPPGNNAHL